LSELPAPTTPRDGLATSAHRDGAPGRRSPGSVLKAILPRELVRWYRGRGSGRRGTPPTGQVDLGSLRRRTPLSRWGFSRGQPIDRYYIQRFLEAWRMDVRGRVLEIGDATYTKRFGGGDVERSDVLHVVPGSPGATIVADLTEPGALPAGAFDCIICTQTLQQLYDPRAALSSLHGALKPGGVLLATVPGISQIDRSAMDCWGDYWRFTTLSAAKLLADTFPGEETSITSHGNVLTAAAFLYGLAAEDLGDEDLAYEDPDYEVLITVRAVRRAE
jgi:SAM-dependent methyltransferase